MNTLEMMSTEELYQAAQRRVDASENLSVFRSIILYDWPEGDVHWRWVIQVRESEIIDWCYFVSVTEETE